MKSKKKLLIQQRKIKLAEFGSESKEYKIASQELSRWKKHLKKVQKANLAQGILYQKTKKAERIFKQTGIKIFPFKKKRKSRAKSDEYFKKLYSTKSRKVQRLIKKYKKVGVRMPYFRKLTGLKEEKTRTWKERYLYESGRLLNLKRKNLAREYALRIHEGGEIGIYWKRGGGRSLVDEIPNNPIKISLEIYYDLVNFKSSSKNYKFLLEQLKREISKFKQWMDTYFDPQYHTMRNEEVIWKAEEMVELIENEKLTSEEIINKTEKWEN